MHTDPDQSRKTPAEATALNALQLVELVSKQEREIVNLRRQVAWFQRHIFGQKSEKRQPEPDAVQGTLGTGDVQSNLPKLAMYMGHVSIVSTAWYLKWIPAVAEAASLRFESHFGHLIDGGAK